MPFAKKYIPDDIWEKVVEYSKAEGNYPAAVKYADELKLNTYYLYTKLKKLGEKGSGDVGDEMGGEKSGKKKNSFSEIAKQKAVARKEAYEGITLTPKEKKLILDISEGKVDLESASRVIASKAFEKLLKYPDSASFTSFIQSELLKLKRQELTDKNTWAMELVNRMFNGELPPRVCPGCGLTLVKLPVLEGNIIIEDESV